MIPPQKNSDFLGAIEDVLEVYRRPYDPKRPVVCLNETSKQHVGETRPTIAARPGQPVREEAITERSIYSCYSSF